MGNQSLTKTHFHACNICEAICGLEITVENNQVLSIKGDKKDPLSRGHICPKAFALKDIHEDPDRIRVPIKKTEQGWVQMSWKQAFDEVASELRKTQQRHGNNAVAVYLGNPTVHNLDAMLYQPFFGRSLRTTNRFSATSVDQLPEQLVSLLMFGHSLLIPVPDLDRTDFLLIFGANPIVSNGSLMTAPGISKRLKSIRHRGGEIVVIDPRKTETAAISNEHIFIKPGQDVLMLLAMLHVVFHEGLSEMGNVGEFTKGLAEIKKRVKPFSPERVTPLTGVEPEQLKALVRRFCEANNATCYGRIGVSTQEHGTLTQWLILVFNIVTGNMDRPGGAMFSKPAFDVLGRASKNSPQKAKKGFADRLSRVRKLPNFNGEFPVATLAEEIITEGEGQIRALVNHAGNPVLSTPNGNQLDKALSTLDFMVSMDYYVNETTRHANIILPPLSALERSHYDIAFHTLAVQNTARFSSPVFTPKNTHKSDCEVFLELAWRMQSTNWFNKTLGWVKKKFLIRLGSEWIVNNQLKKGPYFKELDLDLKKLKQHPHGVDLGPLQPCLPNRLFTSDKMIHLVPEEFLRGLDQLEEGLLNWKGPLTPSEFDLRLIGRRDLRSHNSWLHNSSRLTKGKTRCIALIHPQEGLTRNIGEGEVVIVRSRVGEIRVPISFTEDIMPGVISIPHGWGHLMQGIELKVAQEHAGVNTNILTDDYFLDKISGNAALNGVPVALSKINNNHPEGP